MSLVIPIQTTGYSNTDQLPEPGYEHIEHRHYRRRLGSAERPRERRLELVRLLRMGKRVEGVSEAGEADDVHGRPSEVRDNVYCRCFVSFDRCGRQDVPQL
jgi:hypothetical protein